MDKVESIGSKTFEPFHRFTQPFIVRVDDAGRLDQFCGCPSK